MSTRPRAPARTLVVAPDHAGRRLDNFLGHYLGDVPKSLIYRIIRRGEVRVNGARADPPHRLRAGDQVRIPPLRVDERSQPVIRTDRLDQLELAILYEDHRLLVLNKPCGIAVHPGTGLKYGVVDMVRMLRPHARRIELAHRLDRETSGCLILAKDPATLRDIQHQLRRGSVEKGYTALLKGRIGRGNTRITDKLRSVRDPGSERRTQVCADGQTADTRLKPVEWLPGATLVAVQLLTGRTHQIRSHAAHIGHPVAGDRRYGDAEFNRSLRSLGLRRLFLHAARVRLKLASAAAPLCVEAPLPAELAQFLERLRGEAGESAGKQRG